MKINIFGPRITLKYIVNWAIFVIPVTSVENERVFSRLNKIHTKFTSNYKKTFIEEFDITLLRKKTLTTGF